MNVLYVEGDRPEAELVRKALHRHAPSIRLDHAATLSEAVSFLQGDSAYDVVLAELHLPDGDGLGILTHLQGRDPSPAVVLITGSGDEETAIPTLKAGADDYVVKRVKYVDRLPLTLEDALKHHRAAEARRAQPLSVTASREIEELSRLSHKMDAVGRLASVVAHDFNNILTAILGYSHILEAHLGPGHPLGDDVAEIRKAGERGATITRHLIAFSRRHAVEPQPLDLNAVITRLHTTLRDITGDDVRLQLTLDPRAEPVMADPARIEELITNLATNAREAMPNGGQLTIETQNAQATDVATHECDAAGANPHVMLAFTDTGVGMDAATRSRIFEPFFTTKEKGKGTGLGLATVYAIVQQSGGHIRVVSEPGHGTSFRIYFPRGLAPQKA